MAMDPKTLSDFTQEHFITKTRGETLRLEPLPRGCDRCGLLTQGQKIIIAKKNYEYRDRFWEIRCNICDLKFTVKDLKKFREE